MVSIIDDNVKKCSIHVGQISCRSAHVVNHYSSISRSITLPDVIQCDRSGIAHEEQRPIYVCERRPFPNENTFDLTGRCREYWCNEACAIWCSIALPQS